MKLISKNIFQKIPKKSQIFFISISWKKFAKLWKFTQKKWWQSMDCGWKKKELFLGEYLNATLLFNLIY
jgi:hypothetical protein